MTVEKNKHDIYVNYVGGSGGSFIVCLLNVAKGIIPLKEAINYIETYKNCHIIHDYPTRGVLRVHSKYPMLWLNKDCLLIEMTYNKNDIEEIAKAYYYKHHIKTAFCPSELEHVIALTERQRLFFFPIPLQNCLNVSWNELLHGDPEIFIDKIERFTNIKNLSHLLLDVWREVTIELIND